ncbi:DUF7534 family protein [Haloarcula japonica]|uniref:Uncharacterized protein n=1 Tax=Haloarcula japonica (strain ATCC 49778 / DSM 6131 / JCM 7785 / NBRC 101032 / NCIMB 13157 / TR-1) TaxID=1227453 RepID=M0L6R2_HALJT|nr:hypothetical protein [Haloarcula japonica]EMA29282.1 hypothetical protein C444_14716 [Haloarcula japonica DSM 6131]
MVTDALLGSLPPAVFAALSVLVWATTVGSIGLWTYRDARARESGSPVVWAIGIVFALFILPYYLYRRGTRAHPPERLDHGLMTLASAGVGAFVVGAVLGPPDPVTQLYYLPAAFAGLLPVAYLLVYRGGYLRPSQ